MSPTSPTNFPCPLVKSDPSWNSLTHLLLFSFAARFFLRHPVGVNEHDTAFLPNRTSSGKSLSSACLILLTPHRPQGLNYRKGRMTWPQWLNSETSVIQGPFIHILCLPPRPSSFVFAVCVLSLWPVVPTRLEPRFWQIQTFILTATRPGKEETFSLLNPLRRIGKEFDNLGLGWVFIPGIVTVANMVRSVIVQARLAWSHVGCK